jgi:signal transduction histidine kinase
VTGTLMLVTGLVVWRISRRSMQELPEVVDQMRQLANRFEEDSRSSQAEVLGLELAYQRLDDVLNSIAEGVVVVDGLGEIVLANPAATELLHLETRDQAAPFLSVVPEVQRERVRALLGRCRESGERQKLTDLELGSVHCELQVSPLRHVESSEAQSGQRQAALNVDEHDSILGGGFVLLLHDVTDAIQAQRMKDEFLSSVSHELRTPLTSIRSYAEILLHMTPEDEETWSEFLGIVNIEAERLTRLVNEVLDLAKVEAGKMEFSLEALEVDQLLQTVLAVFRPVLEQRGVTIELDCPELLEAAWADHDRLQQVLTNLVGNAAKFVPDSGRILIRVYREPETRMLHFVIEDDGPGVPEVEREAIFEKFRQAESDLTNKPAGTGLGLPLCRQMLQAMDGEVWCSESHVLGGAALHFRIPVSTEAPRRW